MKDTREYQLSMGQMKDLRRRRYKYVQPTQIE